MKVYDVLVQCGLCNEEVDSLAVSQMWQVGDETARICHRCAGDDDDAAIVTFIDNDQVLDDKEELDEWYKNAKYHVNMEEVDNLFPGEVPEGMVVESVTMWTVPVSRFPRRDWLTVKEVAAELGVADITPWTWIQRGKLFSYQAQGLIQPAGGTTLIHRKVVEEIRAKKKNGEK